MHVWYKKYCTSYRLISLFAFIYRTGVVLLHGHRFLGKKSIASHFPQMRREQTSGVIYVSCRERAVMESEIITICT